MTHRKRPSRSRSAGEDTAADLTLTTLDTAQAVVLASIVPSPMRDLYARRFAIPNESMPSVAMVPPFLNPGSADDLRRFDPGRFFPGSRPAAVPLGPTMAAPCGPNRMTPVEPRIGTARSIDVTITIAPDTVQAPADAAAIDPNTFQAN